MVRDFLQAGCHCKGTERISRPKSRIEISSCSKTLTADVLANVDGAFQRVSCVLVQTWSNVPAVERDPAPRLNVITRRDILYGMRSCRSMRGLYRQWAFCARVLEELDGGVERCTGIVILIVRQPVKLHVTADRHVVAFSYRTATDNSTPHV